MTTIYTIGHSDHEFSSFLQLLQQHGIEVLVDVRSSPYSRHVPQANRESLAQALRTAGIDYRWMGDRLGGKPNGAVPDYDKLRASAPFEIGLGDLLGVAGTQPTAIMCAEGDHRTCHRFKLITPALIDHGAHVVHIQTDGTLVDDAPEPRQLSLF